MPATYPKELRQRVVNAYLEGPMPMGGSRHPFIVDKAGLALVRGHAASRHRNEPFVHLGTAWGEMAWACINNLSRKAPPRQLAALRAKVNELWTLVTTALCAACIGHSGYHST